MAETKLRIVPLGGAGEVGRNCWSLEYGNDAIVLDMGVMFPENEMRFEDIAAPAALAPL